MVLAFILLGVFAVVVFAVWVNHDGGNSLFTKAVKTLPASAFPTRADVYACDECGRDVTKHFRPRMSHSWEPMGPIRFKCICGEAYLTGATEWDYLGSYERRKRIEQTFVIGLLCSMFVSIFAALIYLLFWWVGLREIGKVFAGIIAALPFVLMQLAFWREVAASIWRTRWRTSIEHS